MDRIAEVDFATHIHLDAQVLAVGGALSSYYSSHPTPAIPYWELGFKDIALRLLGSDDFPPQIKADAATALTEALTAGDLHIPIVERLPLDDLAHAHELIEGGIKGRVVVVI